MQLEQEMLAEQEVLVVEEVVEVAVVGPQEQEILHQYLHHKEILEEPGFLEVVLVDALMLAVVEQEQQEQQEELLPEFLEEMEVEVVQVYQSLGYQHLMELQDLHPVDTLLVEEVEIVITEQILQAVSVEGVMVDLELPVLEVQEPQILEAAAVEVM
jgi:hypothetical protein